MSAPVIQHVLPAPLCALLKLTEKMEGKRMSTIFLSLSPSPSPLLSLSRDLCEGGVAALVSEENRSLQERQRAKLPHQVQYRHSATPEPIGAPLGEEALEYRAIIEIPSSHSRVP